MSISKIAENKTFEVIIKYLINLYINNKYIVNYFLSPLND